MRYKSISMLSAGHLFTDINQGAIPALLPFFISEYHLSYAAAATIVFAANIASSVVQPIFGFYSDRLAKVWLMPVGILLAGLGLAVTGVAGSLPLILAAVAVSGCGVAAFHPDAARLANRLAEDRKALAMSIFAVGGNAGFAFGPLLATGAMLAWGIKGTLIFALPPVIVAAFLHFQFRGMSVPQVQKKSSEDGAEEQQDQWFAFLRLSGVVVARSILFFGLNTFIPIYWMHELHQSAVAGGTALTLLFSLGIFATLLGGRLADRLGYRRAVMIGFAMLLPLIAVFTHVHDTFWATAMLLPISLGLFGIYGPLMASGQSFLPNRVGFASGVTIGLAVSIGGVAAPALGWLADMYGIQTALQSLIVIPAAAILLTATLPADKRQPKVSKS